VECKFSSACPYQRNGRCLFWHPNDGGRPRPNRATEALPSPSSDRVYKWRDHFDSCKFGADCHDRLVGRCKLKHPPDRGFRPAHQIECPEGRLCKFRSRNKCVYYHGREDSHPRSRTRSRSRSRGRERRFADRSPDRGYADRVDDYHRGARQWREEYPGPGPREHDRMLPPHEMSFGGAGPMRMGGPPVLDDGNAGYLAEMLRRQQDDLSRLIVMKKEEALRSAILQNDHLLRRSMLPSKEDIIRGAMGDRDDHGGPKHEAPGAWSDRHDDAHRGGGRRDLPRSSQVCRYGRDCPYLQEGTCYFAHPDLEGDGGRRGREREREREWEAERPGRGWDHRLSPPPGKRPESCKYHDRCTHVLDGQCSLLHPGDAGYEPPHSLHTECKYGAQCPYYPEGKVWARR
jgi:hypothetical protein